MGTSCIYYGNTPDEQPTITSINDCHKTNPTLFKYNGFSVNVDSINTAVSTRLSKISLRIYETNRSFVNYVPSISYFIY
jgi:hypothetical protein